MTHKISESFQKALTLFYMCDTMKKNKSGEDMISKNRLLRITLSIISLALVITMLSSCGIANILLQFVLNSADEYVDFNDLEYNRPDFEKIKSSFVSVTKDVQNKKSMYSLQRSVSNAYELYNNAHTQYSIVQIRFYSDVNDKEAKNEITYCAEQFAELDPIINQFYIAVIKNGYQDTFLSGWTENQIKLIEIREKMFDDDYTALVSERTELENEYMEIPSSIRITQKNGNKYSIDEIYDLYSRNQISQQEYANAVKIYYETLSSRAADIYSDMIEIDNTLAKKAGFENYIEYSYRYVYQRDYSSDDAEEMYQYVKKKIVPLYFKVVEQIDNTVLERALHKNNANIQDYDRIFKKYTSGISSSMREAYNHMKKYHLINAGRAEGMQAAGFTTYLTSYDMPYIYLYTYGDLDDIASFVHEFGHFYSYYYNGVESDGIIDVSEIQSQANEWLFVPYYDLTEEEREQYVLYRLSETLLSIIEGCLYDEFQQYTYRYFEAMPYNSIFTIIAKEYRYDEIYSPAVFQNYWSAIHHNFTAPFYYISYAVSAHPALEIFVLSQEDRDLSIDTYLEIVSEVGYRDYLEVLDDADLHSPFEKETYETIVTWVNDYLKALK